MDENNSEVSSNNEINNYDFNFTGTGKEYFKIWIINIGLTVLTLGIYSAWATVRNRRYFYSNTILANDHFSYLATPLSILKGRIIAVSIFVIYSILISAYPVAGLIVLLLILIGMPYFVLKSMAFQRRNTAYSTIRFNFKSSMKESAKIVLLWPLLCYVTLGLAVPQYRVRIGEFAVGNSSLGTTKMNFAASYGDYAPAVFGSGFVLAIGYAVLLFSIGLPGLEAVLAVIGIAIILIGITLWQYMSVKILFSSMQIGNHKLKTNIEFKDYLKIAVPNYLLTIITLGLFYPFARVRITRYITSHVSLEVLGELEEFIATETKNVSALGEELGDVMDFDVGI